MNEIETLIQNIMDQEVGYPIEGMRALIAKGEAAAAPLQAAVLKRAEEKWFNPVPLLVVLGELRTAAALPFFIERLKASKDEVVLDAVSDAISKLGEKALPSVVKLLEDGEPGAKYWALATLGRIGKTAIPHLRAALKKYPEHAGVIALSLGKLDDKSVLEELKAIYVALREDSPCHEDVGDAIGHLSGAEPFTHEQLNLHPWVTLWRPRPVFGWTPSATAARVGYIVWDEHRQGRVPKDRPAKRPLAEVLKPCTDPHHHHHGEEGDCAECGRKIRRVAGLAVCPDNAFGSTLHQEDLLQQCLKHGLKTIPQALDDLDDEVITDAHEWEDFGDERQDAWLLAQHTFEFLLLEGCDDLQAGIEKLRALRAGLGKLWGLPQEEFYDDELKALEANIAAGRGITVQRDAAKIGRNDPCPCSSGKKYKKCCGK
ncbi:MAG: HEAT repeat domain-containing protein [Elusimicrobiota bacterium]|jgi:hypothetical protein